MTNERLMTKIIILFVFGALTISAFSQNQDPKTQGFDPFSGKAQPDSTAADSTPPPKRDTAAMVKPYERLVLYVDSVTNLVSYIGVVEPEEINTTADETTGSDSLYIRAKRWATKKFAGSTKAIFETDKKNVKIVMNAWMPANAYPNKYTKRPIGKYEFKMTVWIKEGRYKYQLTNFVLEGIKSADGAVVRNYFEYFYTAPTNIKGNDMTLRYADKDIHNLIADFKRRMKDPVIKDEEEW